MPVSFELNVISGVCIGLGVVLLWLSAEEGLGWLLVSRRFRATPLSIALAGAGVMLFPIASAFVFQDNAWSELLALALPWGLIVAAAFVERRERINSPHNQPKHQVRDSAGADLS